MENNEQRKELKVSAIENGTVIDHIPANSLFKVIKILALKTSKSRCSLVPTWRAKNMVAKVS